jgi:hypothetical protein
MFRCFSSIRGWVILGAAVIIGGYLALWHGQHVAAALPFLVLLACPLMHIFMHGGHGHHHGSEGGGTTQASQHPDNSTTKER